MNALTNPSEVSDPEPRLGDMVSCVVWKIVTDAVENAAEGQRVTFMLAGLKAEALEGIARNKPSTIKGRTVLLKINPKAAEDMKVEADYLSEESAVHWRHNNSADIVVFAPPDSEREGIGAGLGPISRIDELRIIDEIAEWVAILGDTGEARNYLSYALQGLRDAREVCLDLQMWVEFICSIVDQEFAFPVDIRIKNALPALRIPRDGIMRLPTFEREGNSKARVQDFASAFREARLGAGVYATLMTPKHERVDIKTVRARVDNFDHRNEHDVIEALNATRALLDDLENIRPGGWRPSQKTFCEKVSWERIGIDLFVGRRSASKDGLGKRTLSFIDGNYGYDVTKEDRGLLEILSDTAPREPRDVEVEFFYRWQERLSRDVKLFKAWQKRLFSKEVVGRDLLSAFAEGFEALIVAGDSALIDMSEPRILVRATKHEMISLWQELDPEIHQLFCFELRAIKALFGQHVIWDLEAAEKYLDENEKYPGGKNTVRKMSRKIELELYLVEANDVQDLSALRNPPKHAPRIRTVFQPCYSHKDDPITLALVDDLKDLASAAKENMSLYRPLKFAPRSSKKKAQFSSATLRDRRSFSDVSQGDQGRTFDLAVLPQEDLLEKLHSQLNDLRIKRRLDEQNYKALKTAADSFDELYRRAVEKLWADTSAAFASNILYQQAEAYGELCYASRLPATAGDAGMEIRMLVSGIGVVASEGAEPTSIITAWHPLRLAERRSKIIDLSSFVEAVLTSQEARGADLSGAFEERRRASLRWIFPEVVFMRDQTMTAVEDLGGYSLMVPVSGVAHNQEALEVSAPSAAEKFMEGVDWYLDVYPHESANLSVSIFDAESHSLPREVAKGLVKRLQQNSDLRCDLIMTHREQDRMRSIYRNQNLRLEAETIGETSLGFLSRLRVEVRPNRPMGDSESEVQNLDLVFLHEVISHYADPVWVEEVGASRDLPTAFEIHMAGRPRRRMTEDNASGVGINLTLPRPPRAVGHYQDLLYEIGKGFLPDGYHGVLVRQTQLENDKLVNLIRHVHHLAKWVITYDKVASRTLFERSDIQIISDISLPSADSRAIISAGKVNDRLTQNIKRDVINACGSEITSLDADSFTEVVIRDVLQISGKKFLSAARYANASREMIGLAVMRAWMEDVLRNNIDGDPIWFSLDDYRGWFMSEKGRVADAIAVTINYDKPTPRVYLRVGEAKFVEKASELSTIRDANQQVQETVERFIRLFIDNDDAISRKAACARFADLLVNLDGVTKCFPDQVSMAEFFTALSSGQVEFSINGEAVVCLHDDHGPFRQCEADVVHPYLRHQVLTTPMIRQILRRSVPSGIPNAGGIGDIHWFTSDGVQKSGSVEAMPNPIERVQEDSAIEEVPITEDGKVETPIRHERHESTNINDPDSGDGHKEFAESDSIQEQPRFLPPPVFEILADMATRERGSSNDVDSLDWAQQVAKETQRALSQFGMQVEFADGNPRLTPNGALIAFKGHPTLTVDKIEKRTSELLTTFGIEVAHVRPGRGRISVFVSRESRARVPLASTWLSAQWPDRVPGYNTSFILGAREDEDGLLYLNLSDSFGGYEAHGPHTLIAGETGSGKGILAQGILLQLITLNDPDVADLIVVDPKKGVDFTWLEGAPQMKEPIITEMSKAKEIFNKLVDEMDARYDMFAKVGAANLPDYNRKVNLESRMSRVFLVHDELGAWMAQTKEYQDVVLSSVANLGMKARAAGIHLILITQRADADAVPGRLRDNMGNRLCLKVQNSTGSRMVLGVNGAEKLLGKGHLGCVLANQPLPAGQDFFVVQVPYAETADIIRLADAAKYYWKSRTS